jgi:hypothetical protein
MAAKPVGQSRAKQLATIVDSLCQKYGLTPQELDAIRQARSKAVAKAALEAQRKVMSQRLIEIK